MAEVNESVATEVNEDIKQAEKAQPIVEEIQTVVEENPSDESIKINSDGTSIATKVEVEDAGKVTPVVDVVAAKEKVLDHRLNNKFGAKTVEGETPLNSDLNYQSMFGLGTK